MTTSKILSVAKDFSRFPAGRHRADGPYSGERFRDEKLLPALLSNTTVVVDLDGCLGYGSSFLEEAFGGLVREKTLSLEELQSKLDIRSSDSSLSTEIWSYIRSARPRSRKR